MPRITNFTEAQDVLRPYYDNTQTKYNLNTIRSLMEFLGNPQNQLKVLHIAGTSGKTSTAYYTAALLSESGKSVGLSVSPHVDTMNERLQINGQPLPEAEFCAVLSEFIDLISASGIKPSYFELFVAMVYWELARRGVEYAVIEVGLGGLLDGTNVIERADKVCLITDIGLDHTKILGETLSEITTQKAGIITPGNAVFMYSQSPEVDEVVSETAIRNSATIQWLHVDSEMRSFKTLPTFQQRNLGLAAAAVEHVLRRDSGQELTRAAIVGAANITIPARLETFTINGKTVMIDGSHNQQKIEGLFTAIEQLYPHQDIAALCAFVDGPDGRWQGSLEALLPHVNYVLFTSFYGEIDLPKKSVDPQILAEFTRTQKDAPASDVTVNSTEALAQLLGRPEQILLVTGSFYLLNHIRPQIKELI